MGCVVTAHCYFELSAQNVPDGGALEGSPVEAVTDEHLRKSVASVEYSCPHREIKEEVEVKAENEAVVPQTPTQDTESDAEPSGSGTPLRTDGEDNDKWSTSDNQSAGGGRMMSPGRGRGCKRKR
ncbi:hypothetical protein COOONC_19675 [Cooperia oncophora]